MSPDDWNIWKKVTSTVRRLGEGGSRKGAALHVAVSLKEDVPNFLDLHGMTLNRAYDATRVYLREAKGRHKKVTIITGRSGTIRQEFPFWMATLGVHGRALSNDGSFEVNL